MADKITAQAIAAKITPTSAPLLIPELGEVIITVTIMSSMRTFQNFILDIHLCMSIADIMHFLLMSPSNIKF